MTRRSLSKEQSLNDELLDASRNNDVTTFERCVREGASVLSKNKANWNVLHYIGLYRSYQLLCHVIQYHPYVVDLINDVATDGTTPLHNACTPSPPDIRVIEKFVRIGGDLLQRDFSGQACKDKTHDRNTKNFLQWRKLHPSGLPDPVLDNQKTADNEVIMKYLRTFAFMDDGFARRYEMALQGRVEKSSNIRVIFLGPQGVGKTTMTYNLLETPVPEGGVDSTNVMDVSMNRLMLNQRTGERILLCGNDMERSSSLHRLRDMLGTLSLSEKSTKEKMPASGERSYSGDMAYVNIFDFGGEIMFSNFQHIFLNADAVIILTFSLHNCLTKPMILETLYFWLKFIATYSIGQYRPPVVLVGTHLDQIPEAERKQTLKTIMATFKSKEKNPDIAQIFEQHVVDVIHISNLTPRDPVFDKLWKVILRCAPYQAQWNQLLPGHWIALEHDLMTLKSQGVKVMTFQKIKERALTMDVTDIGAFLRYVKFIATYSIGQYRPPVVLVGTHLDQIPEAERKQTLKTIMATFKSKEKNPDIAQIFEQHVVDVIHISNLTPRDPVFDKLWKVILRCAPYQAQWNQLLPGHWIALEHDLMTLKSQGVKVMTFQKIKERALTMDVTDIGAFLRYLHSARNILTFPTDDNKDLPADLKVILDPEWMIKAFRLIVTEVKYHIKNLGQNDPLLQEYLRTRRLKRAFIDQVWGKEHTDKFLENSNTLLYYIERSELIVKPLPKEDEADADVDTYIVPSLLQDQGEVHLMRSYLTQRNTQTSSTLCIMFKNKFIPDAIYDKFMASLLYRFEVISPKPNEPLLHRGLACFMLTANISMAVHCKGNQIKVTLLTKKPFSFSPNQGAPIRTLLEKLLTSTLQRNDQGHLEYSSHLETDFEISDTYGKPIVTRSEKNFWFVDFEVTRQKPTVQQPSAVPSEGLSLKQMSRIARHIKANSHILFFVALGMEDTSITQIRHDNAMLDFRSQVIRILICWQNDPQTSEEASLELIVDAMKDTSMDSTEMLSEITQPTFFEEAKKVAKVIDQTKVPQRCLVESEVKEVARLVGKMYVVFFIELDFTNEDIENVEVNHHGDVLGMKESLLNDWLKLVGDSADVVNVVMAFQECRHLNWKKLVDMLKKVPSVGLG